MDICKDICQLDLEGEQNEHKCCYYCSYYNYCGNPCDKKPSTCNNLILNDNELLDYVLDKFLNMSKIELVNYISERKDK